MKDLMLDEEGELIIQKITTYGNREIQLVSDKEMIAQQIRQVLRTHLGEWKYDKDEGIDRYILLTKKPNYELIEDSVRSGILQVDESLRITKFECIEKENRELEIRFRATNDAGEEFSIVM